MKDRDYFYAKAKSSQSEDDWNIAKHLRNVANSGIRQAKANYVLSQLDIHSKDSSKFWKELKEVFPTKKVKCNKAKIQLLNKNTATQSQKLIQQTTLTIFLLMLVIPQLLPLQVKINHLKNTLKITIGPVRNP